MLTLEITSIGIEFGIGLAHGGDDVGHAGAGDDEAGGRAAGGAGIAVGHEARALLVARGDVADAGVRQAAIELDRVHAGDAEDGVDAVGLQDLDQHLAAGFRHGPLPFSARRSRRSRRRTRCRRAAPRRRRAWAGSPCPPRRRRPRSSRRSRRWRRARSRPRRCGTCRCRPCASRASMPSRISLVWLPTSRPAVSWATRPAVKTRLPATTAWLMRGPLSMRVMVMVAVLSGAVLDARHHAEHLEEQERRGDRGVAGGVVGRRDLDAVAADEVEAAAAADDLEAPARW